MSSRLGWCSTVSCLRSHSNSSMLTPPGFACSACGEEKPNTEFTKNQLSPKGSKKCKVCTAAGTRGGADGGGGGGGGKKKKKKKR